MLAERMARVEDLEVLVELVSGGLTSLRADLRVWRSSTMRSSGRSIRRPAGRGTTTTPSWSGALLSGSARTIGCSWRSSCTMRRTGCGGRVPTMRRSTGRWSGFRRRAVRALRRARRVDGGQGCQLPVVVSPRARSPRCAAGGRRGRAASARRCRRGCLLRERVRSWSPTSRLPSPAPRGGLSRRRRATWLPTGGCSSARMASGWCSSGAGGARRPRGFCAMASRAAGPG